MFGTLREFFVFMSLGVRKVLSHTSLQHKAVKDEGGQKRANALSCLHTTCKAMNLSNLSQVSRKQTLTTDFIKTANLLALMLVPGAGSASLKSHSSILTERQKKRNKDLHRTLWTNVLLVLET